MSDSTYRIDVTADASGVEAGVAKAKKSLSGLGDAAKQAGKVGGDGVREIGDLAEKSAQQFDRSERSMIAAIQRKMAAMESAGKGARAYQEAILSSRGYDVSKFEPYLSQLDAVEKKQREAAAGATKMGASLSQAIGGLAALAGVSVFGRVIKGAIDAADSINDLSKATGISVDALSGLKLASKQSGAELEGTAQAINKLSVNMGKNANKFAAIGVTAKEPIEAFKQLADVFNSIDDPQMRAAFGAEALGKSWASAAPLLAEGSASIQKMVDKGTTMSGVTQAMATEADAFNDSMEELRSGIEGTATLIAADLLPILRAIANEMGGVSEASANSGNDFSLLAEALRATAVFGGNVAFVLRGVGTEIGGITAQAAAFLSGDFKLAGLIGDAMKEDAEAARKSFDAWESRVMGAAKATKAAREEVDKLTEAQRRGVAGFVSGGGEASSSKSKAVKDAEALESVMNKIYAKESGVETSYVDNLQILQKAYQGGKISLDAYREAVIAFNGQQKFAIDATKEEAEYQKQLSAAHRENVKSYDDRAASAEKAAEAARGEVETYGLTKSAIENLNIARLEEEVRMKRIDGNSEEVVAALEREIEARKRLRAAIAGREVLDANKRATEQMAKDWEKFSDEINRSLTDALMRGFESGKDFGQNFVDSLRTTLKTAVLKVAVQAVVSPITGAVGQAFGLTGSGSSGGAPGLFNLASTGSNLYGLANRSGGGLISGLYGMAATSSFGQTLGLSSAASFVGPSASLASGATAGAAAGEIGLTSLGSSIGAALPWIGGALAIGSALGLFGGGGEDPHNNADSTGLAFKLTKSGVSGTGTGAGITDEVPAYLPYSWVAGQTRGRGRWNDGTALDAATIAQITQASAAVFASGESIAKTLGLSPSLLNSTTVASTGFKSVEDALSQLGDAIAVSLIPNIKEFQASGETLGTTLARLSSEFVLTEQMAAIMGKSGNTAFGASGLDGRDNLIQLLGGSATATSAFDAFWQNFYTQGERADYTKSQISSTLKALGLNVIPATRDEFRKLVEAQDLATDSGRKMYATLLAVSGSFAGITDAAAMGGAYGTRDLKTSSFASRTDYLRAQRATGKAEAVIVSDPNVMRELAQLRAQFKNLEASQVSMARFTLKSAQVLEKWEGIGMPVERAAL